LYEVCIIGAGAVGCALARHLSKHGSLKAKLAAEGNRLFDRLEAELHFGFHRIGALVLAFDTEEKEQLSELYANGLKNDCNDMSLLSREAVLEIEPNLSPDVLHALWAKDVGVTSPYEMTIALAEKSPHHLFRYQGYCRS
jgi:glycerol-3-phosphate dehydrogenase